LIGVHGQLGSPLAWRAAALALAAVLVFVDRAGGQEIPASAAAAEVQVGGADGPAPLHLERVEAFLADKQWDEAVETLRRVMEDFGDRLIRLPAPGGKASEAYFRYVRVRDYGHARLAAWHRTAPAALRLYRARVDPLAARWYQDGLAARDEPLLERVADELFASSHGDDALYALGEMALERGDYAAARRSWEAISPRFRAPAVGHPLLEGAAGAPLWLAVRGLDFAEHGQELLPLLASGGGPADWLAYPDTDLKLDDVRARLVLASILEGSTQRAEVELAILRLVAPHAEGRLGGRAVVYAEALAELLEQSRRWPAPSGRRGWPTFAGSFARNRAAADDVDVAGRPIWEYTLGPPLRADDIKGFGRRRVAEDFDGVLSYHPVVAGKLLLVNDVAHIRVFDVATGKPAWPTPTDPAGGIIYRPRRGELVEARGSGSRDGVPRYTMTVHGDLLFARMGSPVTSSVEEEGVPRAKGTIVGLDLAAQGRMLPGFPLEPEDATWAFEGSPVSDGANLYVGMRQGGALPQAYVACFDVRTGRLRWRRLVCGGSSAGQGKFDEVTHNLLTLDHDTLYYNTNLGAVAALRTGDGAIRWLTVYPRVAFHLGDPSRQGWNFFRDLNPCVLHRGLLATAPADCDRLFALDAATGRLLWETLPQTATDAVHLLGVAGDSLVASGDYLYWFDIHTGKTTGRFPEQGNTAAGTVGASPAGFGRGLITGSHVLWPTREQIYVFEQRTSGDGTPVQARQPIRLIERGAGGGNLLAAGGILLVTTAEKVFAFNEFGRGDAAERTPQQP
jgi:outer membrane protein assembly factor BamB